MRFIDLKAQYKVLKADIDASIQSVLDSAQFIGGFYVKELEKELAAFVNRKRCVTCANGTDALQLAFMAASVGAGDAVFCPDMTFISSTEPAKMFGAVSVFYNILPDTYCLSPGSLERQIKAVLAEGKLTPKAVVAVDFLVIHSNTFGSVSQRNADAIGLCEAVIRHLGLNGNVNFDLKENADGAPRLMEINPRLGGGVVSCAIAGVNFLYLGLKKLLGESLPACTVREGVVMRRRNTDVFFGPDGNEIDW